PRIRARRRARVAAALQRAMAEVGAVAGRGIATGGALFAAARRARAAAAVLWVAGDNVDGAGGTGTATIVEGRRAAGRGACIGAKTLTGTARIRARVPPGACVLGAARAGIASAVTGIDLHWARIGSAA